MDGPASPLKVMLANEPRAYREVISAVFKALRPDVEVFTVEPEDLDREFQRRVPQLVIFSRLTGLVSRDAYAWIGLYPGGAAHAVVSVAGARTTHEDMDLETLLSILDDVATDIHQRSRLRG